MITFGKQHQSGGNHTVDIEGVGDLYHKFTIERSASAAGQPWHIEYTRKEDNGKYGPVAAAWHTLYTGTLRQCKAWITNWAEQIKDTPCLEALHDCEYCGFEDCPHCGGRRDYQA